MHQALSSHGVVVAKHKCAEEAAASYEKAVAIKPDYAHAFTNRGGGSVRECAASRLCKLISGQCVTTSAHRGDALSFKQGRPPTDAAFRLG
jgi:hypothetical protein